MKGKKQPAARPIGEAFFPIPDALFESEQYKQLCGLELKILQLLIYRYRRTHNLEPNKEVALGCRCAAEWFGCSLGGAHKALQRLRESGLITETYKGHLVPLAGSDNISSRWRLNFPPFSKSKI